MSGEFTQYDPVTTMLLHDLKFLFFNSKKKMGSKGISIYIFY